MAERMAKKRRVIIEDEYQNLNFIFGSAAKVERLFSMASFVLTRSRKRMTPQLFEAILFL